MSLTNIVRTADGTKIAHFLSSMHARSFACANCNHGDLTVQDAQGGITHHKWDSEALLPIVEIESHGVLPAQSLINPFVEAVKYVRVVDNTRLFPEGRPKLIGEDLPEPALKVVE